MAVLPWLAISFIAAQSLLLLWASIHFLCSKMLVTTHGHLPRTQPMAGTHQWVLVQRVNECLWLNPSEPLACSLRSSTHPFSSCGRILIPNPLSWGYSKRWCLGIWRSENPRNLVPRHFKDSRRGGKGHTSFCGITPKPFQGLGCSVSSGVNELSPGSLCVCSQFCHCLVVLFNSSLCISLL